MTRQQLRKSDRPGSSLEVRQTCLYVGLDPSHIDSRIKLTENFVGRELLPLNLSEYRAYDTHRGKC